METLFQKYGGFAAISRIILAFYEKVMDSDQIGHFFEEVDIKRLVDHQTKFVSSLLGGPSSFTDNHLRQLHAGLGISNADFDEMRKLLDSTLAEQGVDESDRRTVIREIEARRILIVSEAPS